MKTILAAFLAFGFLQATAQSSDPALDKRLDDYMRLNREMKFAQLIDYIHPSLFTLAPKEAILEGFEKGFDNEDMKITIDSLAVTDIGPVFVHNGGSYHRVKYYMGLRFYMKDQEMMKDSSFAEMMTSQMGIMFPEKKVEFSKDRTHFTLTGPDLLIAIKDDEKSQWMFLGYDKSKAKVLKTLFPKEVVDQFGLDQ